MEPYFTFAENSNDDDDLEVATVLANASQKSEDFFVIKSGCVSDTTGLRSPLISNEVVRETASSCLSIFDSVGSSIYDLAFKGELGHLKHLMNNTLLAKPNERELGQALLAASSNNWLQVVAYLLGNTNVDVNFADESKATALHFAALKGHLKIVEFLISNGADVDAKCKEGNTPLHYAIHCRNISIVDLLLWQNSDVSAQNSNSVTPVALILKGDSRELQDLLRQYLLQLF